MLVYVIIIFPIKMNILCLVVFIVIVTLHVLCTLLWEGEVRTFTNSNILVLFQLEASS